MGVRRHFLTGAGYGGMFGAAMTRSIRLEFPGAYDHLMARGNWRERIFRDDVDRRFFLHALGEPAR